MARKTTVSGSGKPSPALAPPERAPAAKGGAAKVVAGKVTAAKATAAGSGAGKSSAGKTSAGKTPTGKTSAGKIRVDVTEQSTPPPRRRAVANAAAAVHGRTVEAWSEAEIVEAFTRFERRDPEPVGELDYTDAYTLLVAVVLSAQATDVGVNKATRGLFAAAPTPTAMVALGEDEVAKYIRTLGLYRGKAKNVVELSRLLIERHGGAVPQDREALEALPGVGRKTANVVLNTAFGVPTIAVDTHLFRVANRTGLAPGATPLEVELGLEQRIPARFKLHAHHWLILHGRYICKARLPECPVCVIRDLCRWPDKTA